MKSHKKKIEKLQSFIQIQKKQNNKILFCKWIVD